MLGEMVVNLSENLNPIFSKEGTDPDDGLT